jgi:uncharacterized protein
LRDNASARIVQTGCLRSARGGHNHPGMKAARKVLVGAVLAIALSWAARGPLLSRIPFGILVTGPETPAALGAPFERLRIPSHGRALDGVLVPARETCGDSPALLIYHGAGETISLWARTQVFLRDHCVSSIVFDYTGSGDSPRPGTLRAVNQDAAAAYVFARERFGPATRLFLLGHSMGNGPMLQALAGMSPQPRGVIVGNAFSSLRKTSEAHTTGLLRALASLSPDWWNNVEAVGTRRMPLLVVHSEADAVNPIDDGRAIYLAAAEPKSMAVLQGLGHNVLRTPEATWWEAPLQFLSR